MKKPKTKLWRKLMIFFWLVALIPLGTLLYVEITSGVFMDWGFFYVMGPFIALLILIPMLTNQYHKPLSQLVETAQQMASGASGLRAAVANDELGQIAEAMNHMAAELQQHHTASDQYVSRRTETLQKIIRSLELTSQINRQIPTILKLDNLLAYVVNQLQAKFNYYHIQIFLVETETGDLVLAEANGEIGQQLKEEKYRLAKGQGIVGVVAKTNEYVLSNNVAESPHFVPHPLLPDIRSELALPLRRGDEVLGVLAIYGRRLNRFNHEEVNVLQSIANQTAIAIDNAHLMAETQSALQEIERLNRRLTREGWDTFTEEIEAVGYHFRQGKSQPLSGDQAGEWLQPMKAATRQKQLIRHNIPGNGAKARAELAVPLILRDEVIGVLGLKREETSDWAEEEISAVESVAGQIARALENARLSKEQEKTIEQLKEVDRLKSEFLTSMSHELRTPLNSIIGFADVMLQGIDGELPEMAMNDVRLIYNSGQHLLALINDILDLSKIEAGKMELVREPIDIRETFDDVIAASSSLLKDKPVKIVVEAEESLPPIDADRLRLNQILLNLVSNAAKFTDEGRIILKAHRDTENPDRMFIGVADTGTGIPDDKLETIFDRFRQADSSTARRYGGSGLGLAITRQLIWLHDGDLRVTSEVGVGSEFYFTIPIAQSKAIGQEEEEKTS